MYLKHKNINVFYTDVGKGSTIVLLHGFLENSNMWLPFIPSWSKKNRIICIDLLGHGKTEYLNYVHTMELMAQTVLDILNHLKIDKACLIGHSMGGYVALAFAEENPKRTNGLCLMNSTAKADSIERKINRERAIAVVKQNHKLFIEMAISNLFLQKNRILFSKDINILKKEALKTPLQGVIAALEGMKTRKNREALLHNTSFKKMMIIGKKDPVLSRKELLNQTKGTKVKIVEFPDGHMSYIENKYEFSQEIMHFIEYL